MATASDRGAARTEPPDEPARDESREARHQHRSERSGDVDHEAAVEQRLAAERSESGP